MLHCLGVTSSRNNGYSKANKDDAEYSDSDKGFHEGVLLVPPKEVFSLVEESHYPLKAKDSHFIPC
jgi:hypothetical protein